MERECAKAKNISIGIYLSIFPSFYLSLKICIYAGDDLTPRNPFSVWHRPYTFVQMCVYRYRAWAPPQYVNAAKNVMEDSKITKVLVSSGMLLVILCYIHRCWRIPIIIGDIPFPWALATCTIADLFCLYLLLVGQSIHGQGLQRSLHHG